jgi:hypothetical protein
MVDDSNFVGEIHIVAPGGDEAGVGRETEV